MSIGSIGNVNSAWPSQQSSSAQSSWQNVLSSVSGTLGLSTSALQQQAATNIANRTPGAGHHHHHGGGGGGGIGSLLATDDTSSTDSTDAAGPSVATPATDDSAVPFSDQLSAATSASSLLSALTDPSSSQDSSATLANLAGESDLWQGIDTTA